MNCDWVQQNISLYLYNELADDARHELEQHIQRCTDCAAELAAQQEFQAQMNVLPVEEPSASFLAAARMRLQESLETARAESRLVSPLRLRSHGMVAAGAFLAGAGRGYPDRRLRLGAGHHVQRDGRQGTCTPTSQARPGSFHRRHHLHRAQPNSNQVQDSLSSASCPTRWKAPSAIPRFRTCWLRRQEQRQQFRRAAGFRRRAEQQAGRSSGARNADLCAALRQQSRRAPEGAGWSGPLREAGHSRSQCRAGSAAERQQSGRAQRRAACAGTGAAPTAVCAWRCNSWRRKIPASTFAPSRSASWPRCPISIKQRNRVSGNGRSQTRKIATINSQRQRRRARP